MRRNPSRKSPCGLVISNGKVSRSSFQINVVHVGEVGVSSWLSLVMMENCLPSFLDLIGWVEIPVVNNKRLQKKGGDEGMICENVNVLGGCVMCVYQGCDVFTMFSAF